MSEIKTSFSDLDEAGFKSYSDTLLAGYSTSAERKQAISYLQQVNSADAVTIRSELSTAVTRRREQRKKQEAIESLLADHSFDFTRQPSLFVAQSVPDNNALAALLATDNVEVYIKGRTHVGNITISGDNVMLSGDGEGGSARNGTLTNTASVTGDLIIDADNIVIRGINFTSISEKAISFTSGAQNIVFQDCKFTMGAGVGDDGKWWYGQHFGGNLTVQNCRIEDFTSWMLADFSSTSSNTMEQALVRVRIKRNFFVNNRGCLAARGKLGTPMKLCQYSDNKFETDELHPSFWDQTEASNSILKVIVTDNEAIYPVGNDIAASQKRGFCQIWSKDPKPFIIEYSGNTISNLKFGLKVALSDGFYSPSTSDEDFKIDLSASLTAVTYAASFLYKSNVGDTNYPTQSLDKWGPNGFGRYTPLNVSNYPSPPEVTNPSNYTIVTL